ncbi:MAG: hypothetical protein V2B13_00325 [Pseudomonadota bacterium]
MENNRKAAIIKAVFLAAFIRVSVFVFRFTPCLYFFYWNLKGGLGQWGLGATPVVEGLSLHRSFYFFPVHPEND